MAPERENASSVLTSRDYVIAGNRMRAYFDGEGKLIFVVDETISDIKPNVLLVMDPVGARKWDDVLANDYNIDLETVRPKKDNKYQKLDIEYLGLNVYEELLRAFDADADLTDALQALDLFRGTTARRVAVDRLAVSEISASKARDTIAKTNETISDLQARIKQLRTKLSRQKKDIGKEPTKQSAAKILKTEAQVDATNEKLGRAKKRLVSAQRRLVAAEDDAQIARDILSRVFALGQTDTDVAVKEEVLTIPAPQPVAKIEVSVAPMENLAVPQPAEYKNEITQIIVQNAEPKAEIMADEEVKPLFDKDPEILDEEIAFKPIDFNIPQAAIQNTPRAVTPAPDSYSETGAPAPLSFTPPVLDAMPVQPAEYAQPVQPTPVLDTITSVSAPGVQETIVAQEMPAQPVNAPQYPQDNEYAAAGGAPINAQYAAPRPTAMPDVSPAPAKSDFRPVSPIKGNAVAAAAPTAKKPALVYYIMLLLLIVLSIFTLWIYQKSASDNVPDLASAVQAEQIAHEQNTSTPDVDSPFIDDATVTAEKEIREEPAAPIEMTKDEPKQEELAEPVVEPTPVADIAMEIEPEPVPVVPEPVPVVEAEPVMIETPFITPEPVAEEPKKVIPTEEEIIASKPGYNVSQQENMFVADDDYETDVQFTTDVQSTAPVADVVSCADGEAPDSFGCCPGEIYTNTATGFMCCAGDECFPPMF